MSVSGMNSMCTYVESDKDLVSSVYNSVDLTEKRFTNGGLDHLQGAEQYPSINNGYLETCLQSPLALDMQRMLHTLQRV